LISLLGIALPHQVTASPIPNDTRLLPLLSIYPNSINTTLRLQVSNRTIYVGEVLVVHGYLAVGVFGVIPSELTGRNVTLSWGTNSTLETTDQYGWFSARVSFPPGYPSGPTNITASYNPSQSNFGDIEKYNPIRSSIQVVVIYVPTTLTATLSTSTAGPLATVGINGNLSAATGPLQGRTVQIELDGNSMGNAATVGGGLFSFNLTIPSGTTAGTHSVTVSYASDQDVFASANATLQLTVIAAAPSSTTTSTTTSNSTQGVAQITAPSAITVGTLDVAILAIVAGASLASIYVAVKRRKRTEPVTLQVQSPQPIPISAPTSATPAPSAAESGEKNLGTRWSTEAALKELESQSDEGAKVGTAYQLVQELLEERFGLLPSMSETHWEYFSRAIQLVPELEDPLRRIVELFELSQYAPQPATQKQSEAAAHSATFLLLEIIDKAKTMQTHRP
jgi:hypothetical protein